MNQRIIFVLLASIFTIYTCQKYQNEKLNTTKLIFSFSFFHTQKKLRFSQNRPKTAPNTRASFSKDNFLTSSYLAPSLRAKKSNQVSPLVRDGLAQKINYDVACERHIRQELKAGLINGIITVSEITGKRG